MSEVQSYTGPTPKSHYIWKSKKKGNLCIGPYPGHAKTPEKHEKAVKILVDAGFSVFICLQTAAELRSFRAYREVAKKVGPGTDFIFEHYPIEDRKTISDVMVNKILNSIDKHLLSGRNVYVHCFGGAGRSATIACLWLARNFKLSASDAMSKNEFYYGFRESGEQMGKSLYSKEQERQIIRFCKKFK